MKKIDPIYLGLPYRTCITRKTGIYENADFLASVDWPVAAPTPTTGDRPWEMPFPVLSSA
jgi:hypothetical protein